MRGIGPAPSPSAREANRRGFIIPVILCLIFVLLFMAYGVVQNNMQSKSQNLTTIHTTKAQYMAQAAIQHFKLKYKLLPQEIFDAGFLYYGYCPYYPKEIDDFSSGQGNRFTIFMARFVEDITTKAMSPGGGPSLVLDDPQSQQGGYIGAPLSLGGFEMKDEDEDYTEWGYDMIYVKPASMRYDRTVSPMIQEQTVEFKVLGYAKQTLGESIREDKELVKRWEAKETLINRRRFFGKDYAKPN